MRANECDRCKKLYKIYDGLAPKYAKKLGIERANKIKLYDIVDANDTVRDRSYVLDLCPECMTELLDWFGGVK